MLKKQEKRRRRHKKIRAKISGSASRPRLCVFRSAKHIHAQLIDDDKGKALASASDLKLKKPSKVKKSADTKKLKTEKTIRSGKVSLAFEVGKLIAKKGLDKKINKVVFDRGGHAYHGRIKALAEGAREGGLKF
ncbi:50S ribosomal protein L18 [Patescibacteria group bacterium]